MLQNELRGKSTHLVMIAFDLLYLNGYDLRKLPLFERKAHLKKLIEKTDIQYSESFDIDSPTRGVQTSFLASDSRLRPDIGPCPESAGTDRFKCDGMGAAMRPDLPAAFAVHRGIRSVRALEFQITVISRTD